MKICRGNTKTTKYEHILPKLAEIEDSREVDGVLVMINTVGGDVSCGLALAEMIASLSKTNGIPCNRRQPFYRSPSGRCDGLLLYRTHRDDDDTSGQNVGNRDRRCSDIRLF